MTLIRTFLDDQFEYIWGPDAEPASTEKHANESKNKVERFLAFGDNAAKHLEDITASDIIDFCRAIKREGNLSVKTLNRYRSAIGSLFTAAEKYGTISTDDRPRMDYSKEITQKPRYFTLSEIVQITEYLENQPEQWLLHLFTIGHLTGMRVSEIWRRGPVGIVGVDWSGLAFLPSPPHLLKSTNSPPSGTGPKVGRGRHRGEVMSNWCACSVHRICGQTPQMN